jgi:hypothetical protein
VGIDIGQANAATVQEQRVNHHRDHFTRRSSNAFGGCTQQH